MIGKEYFFMHAEIFPQFVDYNNTSGKQGPRSKYQRITKCPWPSGNFQGFLFENLSLSFFLFKEKGRRFQRR